MSIVRKFLDLSTAHLPYEIAVGDEMDGSPLRKLAGVTAYEHDAYGWFVHVPNLADVDTYDYSTVPDALRTVWDYARSLGCDYVLFDRDADVDDALPVYAW